MRVSLNEMSFWNTSFVKLLILASPLFLVTSTASALGITFPVDASALVSDAVGREFVSLVGFGFQYRPMEPATPQGVSLGFEIGLAVSLAKIPDSLYTEIASTGGPSTSQLPSIPMAMLVVHKGVGNKVDLGASFIGYGSANRIFGFDVKSVIFDGEDTPTFSGRYCYTNTSLSLSGVSVSTGTHSIQGLMSKQIFFADPYLGAAFNYTSGEVAAQTSVTTILPGPGGGPVTADVSVNKTATDRSGTLFGGVSFRVPYLGARLTLEGGYDTSGKHFMGTKIGMNF